MGRILKSKEIEVAIGNNLLLMKTIQANIGLVSFYPRVPYLEGVWREFRHTLLHLQPYKKVYMCVHKLLYPVFGGCCTFGMLDLGPKKKDRHATFLLNCIQSPPKRQIIR